MSGPERSGTGLDPDGRRPVRSSFAIAMLAIGVGLLLIGGLEGALRLLGLGNPPPGGSRLRYQQITLPLFRPGQLSDGTPVLSTADPRVAFRSILRRKPEGGLRVFVFGESAVAGLGLSPNATFVRGLEEMLRKAFSDRAVEVVNLGIVALASRQIRELVADVGRSCEPSLLVVYVGNNEFLELHARRYEQAHATAGARLRTRIADTNLVRLLQGLASRNRGPLSVSEASDREMRITEEALIQDLEVPASERAAVIDAYESNLEAMAASAEERRIPVLFMSVASNWQWRGRQDLPETWLSDLVGTSSHEPEASRAGVRLASERLTGAGPADAHEWLYRRAVLERSLGDDARARDDYRAAMNADPHLRRALDEMNARVEAVAKRHGCLHFDTVAWLSARAEGGIVGFGEFYDYVHFTPRGAWLVAAGLFVTLRDAKFLPASSFDAEAFAKSEIADLDARAEDYLEVDRWLGFSFDRGGIADRDLWKHDKMLARLDERIAKDPRDFAALVYRGNARSFRLDGASRAETDYRAALEIRPDDPTARENLRALLAARPREPVR